MSGLGPIGGTFPAPTPMGVAIEWGARHDVMSGPTTAESTGGIEMRVCATNPSCTFFSSFYSFARRVDHIPDGYTTL